MQSYAEQLIRFSQTNSDPSLIPPPTIRTASNGPSPAAPTKYMNYVGAQHDRTTSQISEYHAESPVARTPQATPIKSVHRSQSQASLASNATSEAETDFDGSTDDDTTIRPTHSSASSDAASVYSTQTDDGDDSRDGFDMADSVREHSHGHGTPGSRSSVGPGGDGDTHMASPPAAGPV